MNKMKSLKQEETITKEKKYSFENYDLLVHYDDDKPQFLRIVREKYINSEYLWVYKEDFKKFIKFLELIKPIIEKL
jgi:hypothetical protein